MDTIEKIGFRELRKIKRSKSDFKFKGITFPKLIYAYQIQGAEVYFFKKIYLPIVGGMSIVYIIKDSNHLCFCIGHGINRLCGYHTQVILEDSLFTSTINTVLEKDADNTDDCYFWAARAIHETTDNAAAEKIYNIYIKYVPDSLKRIKAVLNKKAKELELNNKLANF